MREPLFSRPTASRMLRWLWTLLLLVLSGCGGGGGGSTASANAPTSGGAGAVSPPANGAPVLAELVLSADSVDFMAGSGQIAVEATVRFADPEADIATLHVELSDGTTTTVVVSEASTTHEQTTGAFNLRTSATGEITALVWLVDRAGNTSNRLSRILTVRGNARLAGLALSAGPLEQRFQPGLQRYTATVGLLRPTTTVTPTVDDPRATVTVNGQAVESGRASGKVTLDPGSNGIDVVVTAADGKTRTTYSIDVTRTMTERFAQEIYLKGDSPRGRPIPRGVGASMPHGDSFGAALALEGGTLAVGAFGEDSAEITDEGTVYVYSRDDNGAWRKETRLTTPFMPDEDDEPHFGVNVALTGTTLFVAQVESLVGNPGHAPVWNGRVYAYTRQSGQWIGSQELRPARPHPERSRASQFGMALAAHGDTVLIGDPSASDPPTYGPSSSGNGEAFVFSRTGSGWVETARLVSPAQDDYDHFGEAVALDGTTLAIGAPGEDSAPNGTTADPADDSLTDSGAVLVLRRHAGDTWLHEALIKAPNADAGDGFGAAVALSGDTLAVVASREDSAARGIGGDQTDNSAADAGAVYVYARDRAGGWRLEAYIKPSNADAGDRFGSPLFAGSSLQLRDDVLIVGASYEDSGAVGVHGDPSSNAAETAGAVYVFTRDADRRWSQAAYLKASNTDPYDRFSVVAFDGELLAVGAPGEASSAGGMNADQANNGTHGDAGAVYAFR